MSGYIEDGMEMIQEYQKAKGRDPINFYRKAKPQGPYTIDENDVLWGIEVVATFKTVHEARWCKTLLNECWHKRDAEVQTREVVVQVLNKRLHKIKTLLVENQFAHGERDVTGDIFDKIMATLGAE